MTPGRKVQFFQCFRMSKQGSVGHAPQVRQAPYDSNGPGVDGAHVMWLQSGCRPRARSEVTLFLLYPSVVHVSFDQPAPESSRGRFPVPMPRAMKSARLLHVDEQIDGNLLPGLSVVGGDPILLCILFAHQNILIPIPMPTDRPMSARPMITIRTSPASRSRDKRVGSFLSRCFTGPPGMPLPGRRY